MNTSIMDDSTLQFRAMEITDYAAACDLWTSCEGVVLSEADSQPAITFYLQRNSGLSLVAFEEQKLVGTILCGHDGRRGYLHHLAVKNSVRRNGLARELVDLSLKNLAELNITKCHAFVQQSNLLGASFWQALGWHRRDELYVFSHYTTSES